MNKIDLHLHSNWSDGSYTPDKLATIIKQHNINLCALTDHDTIGGTHNFHKEVKKYGIKMIKAVEVSCSHKKESVHVLGYGISTDSDDLKKYLNKAREERKERIKKIITAGDEHYDFPITYGEVKQKAKAEVLCRPHYAMALMDRGYVPNFKTAFNKYLYDNGPLDVPCNYPGVKKAIRAIKKSGGVAVLAHPGVKPKGISLQTMLNCYQFDGVEVFHPRHSDQEVKRYHKITEKRGLLITGGTDYHGFNRDPIPGISIKKNYRDKLLQAI